MSTQHKGRWPFRFFGKTAYRIAFGLPVRNTLHARIIYARAKALHAGDARGLSVDAIWRAMQRAEARVRRLEQGKGR